MTNGICILIWFAVITSATVVLLTMGYILYAIIRGESWSKILNDIWYFVDGKGCL